MLVTLSESKTFWSEIDYLMEEVRFIKFLVNHFLTVIFFYLLFNWNMYILPNFDEWNE